MDSTTLIVGFLISLLANIVFDTFKFLLKSRNRERIKSKFLIIYYFSCEQTKRAQYFVLKLLLFTLPSCLNHMYRKSIQLNKNLSLLFENLSPQIQASFDRYLFRPINATLISYPQLASVNNELKDKIVHKVVACGRIHETDLTHEIGLGIRASDLKPELDSLVIEGTLRRRESGEPGCWHGIQMYELAV